MRDYPYPMAGGVRSIALGIIFTCLLSNWLQTDALNGWLGRLSFFDSPLYPNVWYLCPLL